MFYHFNVFLFLFQILSAVAHQCDLDEREALNSTVFRKIAALSLLPAQKIVPTYKSICTQLTQEKKDCLTEFFQYYEATWLSRVGPQEMSVQGDYMRMSDVQRCIKKELEKLPHPSIFELLRKF